MHRILRTAAVATALSLTAASVALAHTGIGATAGFAAGFTHPLGGLDHVLAMIAVGLWAAQLGGRACWALPLAFVSAMALAGAAGAAGIAGTATLEFGIAGSVLILGALVALGRKLPLAVCLGLVGTFAVFHGQAHGLEMSAGANGLFYGLGFVTTTALLHGLGLGLGLGLAETRRGLALRAGGGAIAALGLLLLAA